MEGVERGGKWKILKERLGFNGLSCCGGGATWGTRASSNMMVREREEEEEEEYRQERTGVGQIPVENDVDQDCVDQIAMASPGMNLATALAAERHYRAAQDWEGGGSVGPTGRSTSAPDTPLRMSLMRLLEETDGDDVEREKDKDTEKEREGVRNNDAVCCVCMGRRKGAAFIPCGHTFCRVCSRELWLNRGSCPLCNRSVLEILDIF